MPFEILDDGVIVEERVIDVDQVGQIALHLVIG
jgi:hypothetical protein